MSFPWHEHLWSETAEFLAIRARPDQRILAPEAFWWIVGRIHRFVPANLGADTTYDWVVLRVDDMAQIPRAFLERVDGAMTAVFANDGFIVWSLDPSVTPDPDVTAGLDRFRARLASMSAEPVENSFVQNPVLADSPTIVRHAGLSDVELRAEMNAFFQRTGYRYPTYRDRVYKQEMQDCITMFLERFREAPARVLDVGSGALSFADAPPSVTVTRVDLSEVGVRLARDADSAPRITHATVDAQWLAFPDAMFDAVVFADLIEHVRDAGAALAEGTRVLANDGWLFLTFANRRSLHCVLQERLGYPEFVSNHHHVREFSLPEMSRMLDQFGLEVEATVGCMFFPYWGVPGVDEPVRATFDDDPPFTELMRDLGRLVGAAHAFTCVVVARRRTARR